MVSLQLKEDYTEKELEIVSDFYKIPIEELVLKTNNLLYDSKGIKVYKIDDELIRKTSDDRGFCKNN